MTALPRNQYSTTFSLDGLASPASPHRSRQMPHTFKPTPLRDFTVVVSVVPADQLRQHSTTALSTPGNVISAMDGVAGVAGVGGPPSMASSLPVTAAGGGGGGAVPPSTPGFLTNASFGPASSSFALTKSFGDVFTRRRPAAPPTTAGGTSNDRLNGSFSAVPGLGASASAAAAAAASVLGLSDPSVNATPVCNSLDSYRVHLLMPPVSTATHKAATFSQNNSATVRSSSIAAAEEEEEEELSAATSSLEALRTPKRRQAAQVSEHWVLFQQLVRFVLSVAPRFEPPPTPPGFAFPVDLGLSFVQNSSIFSAAEAAQFGRAGGGGGVGGSSARHAAGLSSSFFASATAPAKAAAEDPMVSGAERAARRSYMEAYLNAALLCDQVNCLKEVQAFVGYDTYVKNELATFRAVHRTSSSSSIVGSPATVGVAGGNGAHLSSHNCFAGSRTDFTTRGPLGSSSHSTSSRSQYTVSTTSSSSTHRAKSAAAADAPNTTTIATAAAAPPPPPSIGKAASSRGSEVSPPQPGSVFSVSPPALARSLPYPSPEGSHRSSSSAAFMAAAAAAGGSASTPGSVLLGGTPKQQQQQQQSRATGGGGVSGDMVGSLSSTTSGRLDPMPQRLLSGSGAFSPSSSGSHHPLGGSSALPAPRSERHRMHTSVLLGAAEVENGSSRHSSQSAGSSFGSSVSHPGSAQRRRRHRGDHHRQHSRQRDPSGQHVKRTSTQGDNGSSGGSGSDEAAARADGTRRERRRVGGRKGDEAEEEVAAPPLPPPPPSSAGLVTPAATTSRADLSSLVSMAPETERMLTECFRMMDTAGCGYVSAGDCVLFYLCATPDTFVAALYRYTHGVSADVPHEDGDHLALGAAATSPPSVAELEALLPDWMRECESVVVGNSHYLVSCTRFVDAVREVLAASAAVELAAGGGSSAAAAVEADGASTTRPHSSVAHTSVSGDGNSRIGTPASSLPSTSVQPTVLVGSLPSRDGRHAGEGTPLQPQTAAAVGPVASLETWIDNYWLLLDSHLFAAVAAVVVGPEAARLRATLFSIRERAYMEMAAQVAAAVEERRPAALTNTTANETASAAEGAFTLLPELTCPPWVLREVAAALAAQPPILGCFDVLELVSLVYVITESGIAVVGLEDVLQWLGTRSCAASTRFSLDDFASLLDMLSCSLPFTDVLHCVRQTQLQQQQQQQQGGSASDSGVAATPPLALLLRLVSRCATADPASGREFNELVQEQRWRRGDTAISSGGGVGGGGERGCAQCQLSRGVLEQQAVLVENLSAENAALQLRIAALEETAAAAAAAGGGGDGPGVSAPAPAVVSCGTAAGAAAGAAAAAAVGDGVLPATTATAAAGPPPSTSSPATAGTSATSLQPLSSPALTAASASSARPAPYHTTIELVPIFTEEEEEGKERDGAREITARRLTSRRARAVVTQVARAGPLLYTVPPKYTHRQPTEVEVSLYLCRSLSRSADGKGTAAAVERLTLRDASGHRVLACKLSGTVLQLLGRDTAPPRSTCLSLVTAEIAPAAGRRWAATGGSPTSASPHRSRERHRRSRYRVVGRENNILYPCYEDSEGDGSDSVSAAAVRYGGTLTARPHRGHGGYDIDLLSGALRLGRTSSSRATAVVSEAQRRVARVELQPHVWYTLKVKMDWEQHVVEVAVVSTTAAAAGAALTVESNRRVFEGTFGMLDAVEAAGLVSLDVLPRRKMLVAYCNVLIRYAAATA